MDDRAIAQWRAHTQRLSGQSYATPGAVVAGLLAVQSENHAQASWAVATRTMGVTEKEFARLFDDGAILRTHVLRPTWHYVRPDDIRWLLALTAPRVSRLTVRLRRELDLGEVEMERAQDTIVEALSGGHHLTRGAIGERLRDAGLPADSRRVGVIMMQAELSALVSGALDVGEHTYALLDERASGSRRLDREEALAELVLRYFTGHGPATERDLAYWATLTLTDVRAGLAAVGDQLDHCVHEGRTYWFAEPPPEDIDLDPRAHLLQILDEYHHGYQDSRFALDADGLVPQGRAATMGAALVDGQMLGDMRRTVRTDDVAFEVGLYRDLRADERDALQAAAERYAAFLGREATLTLHRWGSGGRPKMR